MYRSLGRQEKIFKKTRRTRIDVQKSRKTGKDVKKQEEKN